MVDIVRGTVAQANVPTCLLRSASKRRSRSDIIVCSTTILNKQELQPSVTEPEATGVVVIAIEPVGEA